MAASTASATQAQPRAPSGPQLGGLGRAKDVGGRLETNLPVAAASSFAIGFFLAGGIGATMRLLARRGREGREKARFGRLTLVDHG